MSKKPTLKDIAQALGLSQSTISMVLSEKADGNRIPAATQQLVRQKAAEMGYVIKKHQRLPGKRVCIGFFLPTDIVQGPIAQVMNGITRYHSQPAEPEEELMIVVYDHGNLDQKRHLLQGEGPFHGAILMGTQEKDIQFLRGFQPAIPILLINRESPGCYSVMIDDYEVGRSAAEHFLKRGHRNLAVIAPTYTSKSLGLRITGFTDFLREHASEQEREAFVVKAENDPQGGQIAARRVLEQNPEVTAIFLTNDNMAAGCVRALNGCGRQIPRDVELISFGDREADRWSDPPLTSFAYPVEQMVCDAIGILIRACTDEDMHPFSRNYAAQCIYRVSCPAAAASGR